MPSLNNNPRIVINIHGGLVQDVARTDLVGTPVEHALKVYADHGGEP